MGETRSGNTAVVTSRLPSPGCSDHRTLPTARAGIRQVKRNIYRTKNYKTAIRTAGHEPGLPSTSSSPRLSTGRRNELAYRGPAERAGKRWHVHPPEGRPRLRQVGPCGQKTPATSISDPPGCLTA